MLPPLVIPEVSCHLIALLSLQARVGPAPIKAVAVTARAAQSQAASVEILTVSRADYAAKVKTATETLVRERLLLPEDADRFLEKARAETRVNP